ncbi:MAG: hypothetical protein OXI76_08580 [Gemmatimonadota bacterium]|nr:hypothetical protein [Gemmatimonadota bacterium]
MVTLRVEHANLQSLVVGHDQIASHVTRHGLDVAEEDFLRPGEVADRQSRFFGQLCVDNVAGRCGDDPDPGGVGDFRGRGGRCCRTSAGGQCNDQARDKQVLHPVPPELGLLALPVMALVGPGVTIRSR